MSSMESTVTASEGTATCTNRPESDSAADYPQPLVSVVMPVRDQERVLCQTLESVLAQSLENFELVLVDDGSADGSPGIEREFADRDPRVRLFPREAQGAGPARNFGLGRARGRYVILLDSDDLFHPDLLLDMASVLEATGADVCVCEADTFDGEGPMKPFVRFGRLKEGLYPRHALGRHLFQVGPGSAWNNMYRRDFLLGTGILFQDLKNSNDSTFTDLTMLKAERIYLLKGPLVFYRQGLGTSIQDTKREYPFEALKAAEKLFNETHERRDLSPSVETGLRMRCASLLASTAESLIATQAYDESTHERLAVCLQHWGSMGAPHTTSELKAVMKAGLIKHATYEKAVWANTHWKQKVRCHTPLEKLDYSLRIIIAIALSNFPPGINQRPR